jgi:hypothetical protein
VSLLALAAFLFALVPAARADEIIIREGGYGPRDRYSLGFMLGDPTGLTLEKNLRGGNAWDLGLGFVYGPGVRLHGDYKWTIAASRPDSDFSLRFQIGVGALVGSLTHPCEWYGDFGCDNGFYVGARVPIDIEIWPRAPINLGIEVAPVIAFNHDRAAGFLDAFFFIRFVL